MLEEERRQREQEKAEIIKELVSVIEIRLRESVVARAMIIGHIQQISAGSLGQSAVSRSQTVIGATATKREPNGFAADGHACMAHCIH